MKSKIAVITGASSGIGEATARIFAAHGYQVFLGARRVEKVMCIAKDIGGVGAYLDVTNAESVSEFVQLIPEKISVLVNNAGGALGLEPISDADEEKWKQMYDTNVLGLMRVTKALYSNLIVGEGHVINITSIAGREVYPGGAGYTAVKHAARAITETLRLELNGTRVRVTDIAPGLVETEFSQVRFAGDADRAKKVYQGVTPLSAGDIAECILWCAERPWHVNIDTLVLKPVAQATATIVARGVGL